jgi:hypothetical protein
MPTPVHTLVEPTSFALISSVVSALGATCVNHQTLRGLDAALSRAESTAPIVIADTLTLSQNRLLPAGSISRLRAHARAPHALVIASHAQALFEPDLDYFQNAGAHAVFPRLSAARWDRTGKPFLDAVSSLLGKEAPMSRISPIVRSMRIVETASAPSTIIGNIEGHGVDLHALAFEMSGAQGVAVRDRSYRLKSYPECFIASEATDWIAQRARVSRSDAAAIGRAMQALGLIYHVVRERDFGDENLFFRFTQYPTNFSWTYFLDRASQGAGIEIADRSYHGRVYPATFVGKQAAQWMQKAGYSVNESMSIGQRMIDLSLAHHVTDEHAFKAEDFFYRFYKAEPALA